MRGSRLVEDVAEFNNSIPRPDIDVGLRQGTIIAVDGDTVTIDLGLGEIPNVKKLSSYSPIVGDVVEVVQFGADYLVIGTMGLVKFSKIRERPLNPLDRGDPRIEAIADGSHHPLSDRFDSLTEAQDHFSFVDSLAEGIDRAAIQSALNASRRIDLGGTGRKYWMDKPVDGTRKSGTGEDEGLHIAGKGAFLIGETGAKPVIDITAQRNALLEGFRIDPGNITPSQIGIVYTRNSLGQSAARSIFRDLVVYVRSDTDANGGYGAVAFYNICGEVAKMDGVDLAGDVALVIRHDNFLNFQSDFVDTLAPGGTSTMAIAITDQVRAFGWRHAMDITGQMHYHNGLFVATGIPMINPPEGAPTWADAVAIKCGASSNLHLRGSCEGHTKLLEMHGGTDGGRIDMKHHQAAGVPVISSGRVRAGLRGMRIQVTNVASSPEAPLIGSSLGLTFDLSSCEVVTSLNQTIDLQQTGAEGDRVYNSIFRSAVVQAPTPTILLTSNDGVRNNRRMSAEGEYRWDGTTWVKNIPMKGSHTETDYVIPEIPANSSDTVLMPVSGIRNGDPIMYAYDATLGSQFSVDQVYTINDNVGIVIRNNGASAATPNVRTWKFVWA